LNHIDQTEELTRLRLDLDALAGQVKLLAQIVSRQNDTIEILYNVIDRSKAPKQDELPKIYN
jgi:hypothetical protein